MLCPEVADVHARIKRRSEKTRAEYLKKIARARENAPSPSCANLAHACAACGPGEKQVMLDGGASNIGIVTAYNDMLSAHQPFEDFPSVIKQEARRRGATAQVAGGVPAMCDGVTQGRDGMELSLFSRDVIAMASAVALSHGVFDGAMFLGVCDKIAPGMLIAAARFGHLPAIFAPAGPMPSGLPNADKARARERHAAGEIGRRELLAAEAASYHAPGTCTFYGTANTNQMMLEIMGMQLPGTSFVNPGTPMRRALTEAAVRRLLRNIKDGLSAADVLSPAAFVNAMVGVLATGGSTNHALHIPAVARACGVLLEWQDFADLSRAVPLLCKLYPAGSADVNRFHAAGGMSFVAGELLSAGLLIGEVKTVTGGGLEDYALEPKLGSDGEAEWGEGCKEPLDAEVVRPASKPFSDSGGLLVAEGNLGQAIIKTSALPAGLRRVRAPARIFDSQDALMRAFHGGELDGDFTCVVRFQGPRANGMPELHRLTPPLAALQNAGKNVSLVTDGRMSGASGKVPAAIHLTPEAAGGGPIAMLRDGDMIEMDMESGALNALVADAEWRNRQPADADLSGSADGCGRELFSWMRARASPAPSGGGIFFQD